MGRSHESATRGGVTLIELLVVMAIAAIVGALAVTSFAAIGRRASREGAAEQVLDMLRRAQVSAVDSGRGAVVRINPSEGSVYGLASTVEGAWHFEEVTGGATPGAKGYHGAVYGSPTIAEGAVGLCLRFDPGNDYVDCGAPPVFDQTDGVRIEAWVRPEGAGVLGVMGKSRAAPAAGYAMGLRRESTDPDRYSVRGGFYLEGGLAVALATNADYEIPGEEWSHVAIEFDGYEARLLVNGVLADLDSYRANEGTNPVDDPNPGTNVNFTPPVRIGPARGTSLTIGEALFPAVGSERFRGRIDEPKLLSVAGGQRASLPEGVPITASDGAIHFDGQGRLDIAYHAGPVYAGVGDPYQAAELAADLPAGSAGPMLLRPRNPMPPTGGVVLIGGELISYGSAAGLQLNSLTRGRYGTAPADHWAGDPVYFARVVRVTPTGMVDRVRSGP